MNLMGPGRCRLWYKYPYEPSLIWAVYPFMFPEPPSRQYPVDGLGLWKKKSVDQRREDPCCVAPAVCTGCSIRFRLGCFFVSAAGFCTPETLGPVTTVVPGLR